MTVDGDTMTPESSSSEKLEISRKERPILPPTKVVIRKLPPTFTEEELREVIAPISEHNYFYFATADRSLGIDAFSRAYINFINPDEVLIFRNLFDGYVFVDKQGNEFPAIVEYASFQKIPKQSSLQKKDVRCGTIDDDSDYVAFLEALENAEIVPAPQIETLVEEIEAKERELRANHGILKMKTPLLEYIEKRNADRASNIERRKKKELEKKKARDEERRRKKEQLKKVDEKEERTPKKGKETRRYEDKPERKDKNEKHLQESDEKPSRQHSKKFSKDSASSKPKEGDCTKDELVRTKRYSEARKFHDKDKKPKETPTPKEPKNDKPDFEFLKPKTPTKKSERKFKEKKHGSAKAYSSGSGGSAEENCKPRRAKETAEERRECRIRNKDRPAMQLYRPGQSRLKPREDGADIHGSASSLSSGSPIEPETKARANTPDDVPIQSETTTSTDNKPSENKKSFSYAKSRAAKNMKTDKKATAD